MTLFYRAPHWGKVAAMTQYGDLTALGNPPDRNGRPAKRVTGRPYSLVEMQEQARFTTRTYLVQERKP